MSLFLAWICTCERCSKTEVQPLSGRPEIGAAIETLVEVGWRISADVAYCPHCVTAAPALIEELHDGD